MKTIPSSIRLQYSSVLSNSDDAVSNFFWIRRKLLDTINVYDMTPLVDMAPRKLTNRNGYVKMKR